MNTVQQLTIRKSTSVAEKLVKLVAEVTEVDVSQTDGSNANSDARYVFVGLCEDYKIPRNITADSMMSHYSVVLGKVEKFDEFFKKRPRIRLWYRACKYRITQDEQYYDNIPKKEDNYEVPKFIQNKYPEYFIEWYMKELAELNLVVRKKISRTEIALMLGYSKHYIDRFFQGREFRFDVLLKVLDICGYTIELNKTKTHEITSNKNSSKKQRRISLQPEEWDWSLGNRVRIKPESL